MNRLRPALVLSMLVLAACSTSTNSLSVAGIAPVAIKPLESNEYKMLGNVEGQGSWVGFLCFSSGYCLIGGSSVGDQYTSKARQQASFNAVASVPDADALIAPRYEGNFLYVPLLFASESAKIRAKAIQITKK